MGNWSRRRCSARKKQKVRLKNKGKSSTEKVKSLQSVQCPPSEPKRDLNEESRVLNQNYLQQTVLLFKNLLMSVRAKKQGSC